MQDQSRRPQSYTAQSAPDAPPIRQVNDISGPQLVRSNFRTSTKAPSCPRPADSRSAQLRVKGSKDVLEPAILADGASATEGSQMRNKWRARRDSNSCSLTPILLALSHILKCRTNRKIKRPIRGLVWVFCVSLYPTLGLETLHNDRLPSFADAP
jgi:hypothetical protein